MAQPYIGEIRQFGGNFAPVGWQFCRGQIISIAENEVLYQLIGTTYGGNGVETFGLPDLQGRIPLHMGTQGDIPYVIGQKAGVESVTLTTQQIPAHTHVPSASTTGGSDNPSGAVWGPSTSGNAYAAAPGSLSLGATTVNPAGGSQPHDNMHPFTAVSYIIAMYGVFPTQS